MKSIAATILFSLASYAYADNYQVMVGATGLTFSPNFVMADAGDTIEFIVVGQHSVTESSFSSPCSYTSGAWSGVSPTPNFVITVTDTSSRFFYCTIDSHCPSGMVFALNPSGSETESAYAAAAVSAKVVTPSGSPTGGTSGPVPTASSSAGTSAASVSASSVASSATAVVSSSASAKSAATGAATGTATGTPSSVTPATSDAGMAFSVGSAVSGLIAFVSLMGLLLI